MLDVVAELGHLRKLAEQDANKRFSRLYRLLRQSGLLALARERIASNKGAQTPGVDGEKMGDNLGFLAPAVVDHRRKHIPVLSIF